MFLALVLTVHCTQGQVDLKILYTNTCRIMLKKFLICEKAYTTHIITLQKFLLKIVNIFTFTSSMVSMITIILVIYLYCKSGSPHLFKFTGTLYSEDIKLNKNYLWDTLEINWDKIKLTFNDSEIKLPRLVTIKMRDKIRMRRMMSKDMQNFHVMIKQGITWYNPEAEIRTV